MPQFTSNTLSVSDNGSTSHDTNTIYDNVRVESAECRWQGVDREVITQEFDQQTISNEKELVEINGGSQELTGAYGPSPGTNYAVISQGFAIVNENPLDTHTLDLVWTVEDTSGGSVQGIASSGVEGEQISVGGERSENLWFNDPQSSGTVYDQYRASVNPESSSQDHSNWTLRTFTEWRRQEQSEIRSTENPSVSGDVSSSYSGTLSNGTWTSWQTLSGLSENTNTFNHSIDGSGVANFEFRYNWEYDHATPVKDLRSPSIDGTTIQKVALANPSDEGLSYTHITIPINGTNYAVDLVDDTDPNAITEISIETQYGTLHPRVYDTVTL